jgi:hypothetical protein
MMLLMMMMMMMMMMTTSLQDSQCQQQWRTRKTNGWDERPNHKNETDLFFSLQFSFPFPSSSSSCLFRTRNYIDVENTTKDETMC